MFSLCALLALATALLASAEIYVVRPSSGSVCHGGKPCTVEWLDDGTAPILPTIGLAKVGLYTGHLQLVQALAFVNVSDTHSFTFTPTPSAGPNSDSYYISFTPMSDTPYRGFSPWFTLDEMTGSFSSPDPAATSFVTPSTISADTTAAATLSGGTSVVPVTTETLTSTGTRSESGQPTSSAVSTLSSLSSSASLSSTRTSATGSLSSTRTSATATATRSNAAIANTVPATGFAWTLIALLGLALV